MFGQGRHMKMMAQRGSTKSTALTVLSINNGNNNASNNRNNARNNNCSNLFDSNNNYDNPFEPIII